MAAVFKITGSGPASALLLLAALLAAGARADKVTTADCAARSKSWESWVRVRRYPVDSDATSLYMDSCSLTSIPQQQLSGLPAVTSLTLWKNKLRELPVFDEHTCQNLTHLAVTSNQLTELNNAGTFSACMKLEVLYLKTNQIQFISQAVFTALPNLKYLNLQVNKIRFIPDQMFSNNGKLVKLYLDGNMITHLPPDFASKLKRTAASLDVFSFNDNPWHCACLIELLADVRRAGVRDYSKDEWDKEAYSGAAPVCVYTGTAPCCRRAPTGLLRAARGGGRA